jgi:hypothetical protein
MAGALLRSKLYQLFTNATDHGRAGMLFWRQIDEGEMVAAIALAMFIALFAWGARYFGWSDPTGKVQLALFTAFILGIAASYKSRG